MTDQQTNQNLTDTINIAQSRIIWFAIVTAVGGICGILDAFGIHINDVQEMAIEKGMVGVIVLASALAVIYHRIYKPCPPIATKDQQPKQGA